MKVPCKGIAVAFVCAIACGVTIASPVRLTCTVEGKQTTHEWTIDAEAKTLTMPAFGGKPGTVYPLMATEGEYVYSLDLEGVESLRMTLDRFTLRYMIVMNVANKSSSSGGQCRIVERQL